MSPKVIIIRNNILLIAYYGDDKTKRSIKILMVFLLSVPLLISPAAAWSQQSHQNAASQIYYSLPVSAQYKLNLNEMQKGSIAPDTVFKNKNNHVYPKSYAQAKKWLNAGKNAYGNGNYNYASYCFGVASHYIEDTFSGPHCYAGETHKQHVAYEKQANYMMPSVGYMGGSLKSVLRSGYTNGKTDMRYWLKTRSSSIVQNDFNNGASAAYSMIRNCV